MAEHQPDDGTTRRDFVAQAATTFSAIGLIAAAWPLITQMNPNDATPPPEVTEVDLRAMPAATTRLVRWKGLPVFLRHRTREEIEEARSTPLSHLPDPLARNALLPERAPAIDANRTKAGHEEWLVVVGLCTHLGCILRSNASDDAREAWICPCHASRFDVSGRVRAGPARTNLPVPPYEFPSRGKIMIG